MPRKPPLSRAESIDALIAAMRAVPVTKDELSAGELIAVARYHLDYVIVASASGQSEKTVGDVIETLEEVLLLVAGAAVIYKKHQNGTSASSAGEGL